MSPVFGLQAILGGELTLRLQYQLGNPPWVKVSTTRMLNRGARGGMDKALRKLCTSSLHRRSGACRDNARRDWSKCGPHRIDSELGEVFRQGLRPAEVAEAQADHSERIRDTAIVVLIMFLIEVVTDRYLVVEQGNILLQGLLVEIPACRTSIRACRERARRTRRWLPV